jgi:CRP/FNR family transcriptional regulator, nitrogen oxide reductase regulator
MARMSDVTAPLTAGSLDGTELFLGLAPAALAEVMARARVRRLAKETTIFLQGAPADGCHVLLEGRVRIAQSDEDGAQLVVRFIGPGEMFGTMALFTDREYPAEAVAVVDSLEISWPEPALLELIGRYPQIALNIVRIVGARLREVQERLRELATQRVERRIAHVLLRLADQAGARTGAGTKIDFPLTRKDVAEMCGTTLHTVSRVLTAWEKAGLIVTNQQRVTIHAPAEIQRIADDPPR